MLSFPRTPCKKNKTHIDFNNNDLWPETLSEPQKLLMLLFNEVNTTDTREAAGRVPLQLEVAMVMQIASRRWDRHLWISGSLVKDVGRLEATSVTWRVGEAKYVVVFVLHSEKVLQEVSTSSLTPSPTLCGIWIHPSLWTFSQSNTPSQC